MDLVKITVSFHILLCPAWALSRHASMDSILSARSGKACKCTVRLTIRKQKVCDSPVSDLCCLSVFLSALRMLDEPLRFEPCCLTSPPPPPLFPPPPQLWKRGSTVGVHEHTHTHPPARTGRPRLPTFACLQQATN